MLEFEYTSVFESFEERATLPREVREAGREGSTACVSVNVVGPRAPKVQKDKQIVGEHVPRPRAGRSGQDGLGAPHSGAATTECCSCTPHEGGLH